MQIITYVLAFIAAVGIIVTVHEFGHFWVAKKLGVKVLRFSVGFGKPLLKRIAGTDETEYVLASIPLGGYVKMLDEREGDVAEQEAHRAFNRQVVWKRFAIVSAGPIFNFIFAVFAYWITFIAGVDGMKPVVGEVEEKSIAQEAGIKANDIFTHIGDVEVKTWQQTSIQLMDQALKHGVVEARMQSENAADKTIVLNLSDTKHLLSEGGLLEKIGLTTKRYDYPAKLDEVTEDGAAKQAGMQAGDLVLSVDNMAIQNWNEFAKYIHAHADVIVQLRVERNGEEIDIQVTPQAKEIEGETIGLIGVKPFLDQADYEKFREKHSVLVKYNILDSFAKSLTKTWEVSVLTLKLLWKLVVGEASLKNISGPVTIAEYAGVSAAIGFSAFVGALAIISISIGILNLLPIPVLDGGHLFYYLIEMVKGSPVSEQFEAMGQRIGIVMLAGLMGLAFYNDIYRLIQ